jgi:hypothetical protein
LLGTAECLTVSPTTTPHGYALDDADAEYTYLDVGEALVLHAEIKGLPLEAVFQEVRDVSFLESALARPYNAAAYGAADNLSVLEVAELLRGAVQPVAEPEP